MIDIAALVITLLIVIAVFLRKTSAGLALLALLAGVLLDLRLSSWIIGALPESPLQSSPYFAVVLHIVLTFSPMVVAMVVIKVGRSSLILTLVTSLVLGFLVASHGIKIIEKLPPLTEYAKNSGLLHFLDPYQNGILAGSTIIGLAEVILSHRSKAAGEKKKK